MQTFAKLPLSPLRTAIAATTLALALTACGSGKWGFPYRADVQQGNWITAEQVAQLQVGMTREQVRFILGSPTLTDVLHANRWDYPYMNKPGYGDVQQRRFTVWFDNNSLVKWEGDQQPNRQPYEAADSGMSGDAESTDNVLADELQPGVPAEGQAIDTGTTISPDSSIIDIAPERLPDPGVPTPSGQSPVQILR